VDTATDTGSSENDSGADTSDTAVDADSADTAGAYDSADTAGANDSADTGHLDSADTAAWHSDTGLAPMLSAAVSPNTPRSAQGLVCQVTLPSTADPATAEVLWAVDGAAYAGATETTTYPGDTIAAGVTQFGQRWQCAVAVDDDGA